MSRAKKQLFNQNLQATCVLIRYKYVARYMNIANYLTKVSKHCSFGYKTERTYRSNFATLIKSLAPNINIGGEPSDTPDCRKTEYIITQKKHLLVLLKPGIQVRT